MFNSDNEWSMSWRIINILLVISKNKIEGLSQIVANLDEGSDNDNYDCDSCNSDVYYQ